MQDTVESETNDYLDLLKEIEEKKHQYKLARRSLMWYRNILLSFLFLAMTAIILVGILGKIATIADFVSSSPRYVPSSFLD
jgi:hypothetical protein